MVSPELLRRYPFFGFLDDAQLKAVAMLAEEVAVHQGETLLENDRPAAALFVLLEGSAELDYVVMDRDNPRLRKEFYISDINPGEVSGISALIEPYIYTATVRATSAGRVVRIDAAGLRALCEVDSRLAAALMRQLARAAMERLHDTRVQLVAARA
jgi:CRP-like cAMP-binding protein